jgi:Mannosyltransferase (PIG-M)
MRLPPQVCTAQYFVWFLSLAPLVLPFCSDPRKVRLHKAKLEFFLSIVQCRCTPLGCPLSPFFGVFGEP